MTALAARWLLGYVVAATACSSAPARTSRPLVATPVPRASPPGPLQVTMEKYCTDCHDTMEGGPELRPGHMSGKDALWAVQIVAAGVMPPNSEISQDERTTIIRQLCDLDVMADVECEATFLPFKPTDYVAPPKQISELLRRRAAVASEKPIRAADLLAGYEEGLHTDVGDNSHKYVLNGTVLLHLMMLALELCTDSADKAACAAGLAKQGAFSVPRGKKAQ